MTRLEDLPAFEIKSIAPGANSELRGVLTHLRKVRPGRSWLYAAAGDSLIGDLVDLDETTRQARFIAPFWTPTCSIQVGTRAPWLDGFWQADHVAMILDDAADWRRSDFLPSAAQHFRQGTAVGWTKVGTKLPEGAVPTHIGAADWDHEHCELCQSKIGRGGSDFGYVDRRGHWLCEPCYGQFAATRSLGFVFDT